MARMARQLQMLVLLGAALVWPAVPALAQAPLLAPAAPRQSAVPWPRSASTAPNRDSEVVPAPTADDVQPEILRSLPRPPDQPGSLVQEATFGPPPRDWEHPYFERDPLLDPLDWPQPGWFTDVEVGLIKPHVTFPVATPLATMLGAAPVVQIGSPHLNWTAAPRFEVGYRLPSGFGEFSISDRYLNTTGSDTVVGRDGAASRHSRFMVNYTDVDYASRELTPWNNWNLKFRGGLRVAQTSFSTTLDEPIAQAAAGSGVFSQRQFNSATGFGSHFGFELDRRFARRGLTLVSQADVSDVFMHTRQGASATLTTLTPTGGFDTGSTSKTFVQQNPIVTLQIGLSYQSPRWRNSRLYLGYFGQFWYLFATDTAFSPVTPTHFDQEGVVFQWSWNH